MPRNNKSNTLILTDQEILHPDNASVLQETIEALKEFIKSLNRLYGLDSCLQVLHLKSLGRLLLIFTESKFAEMIFQYLDDLKLKIGFARNDNVMNQCDLHLDCETPCVSANRNLKLKLSDNQNEPINERLPTQNMISRLEPPNPPIQMQSPPPSPYEGWVNQPEEAPSDTTISYHPKMLSHILYTVDPITNEHRRVFSSFIDSEQPEEKYTDPDLLQELDIGEALDEGGVDDEEYCSILRNPLMGSLFQQPMSLRHEIKDIPKVELVVPILVIDNEEAFNLREHANTYYNVSHNND